MRAPWSDSVTVCSVYEQWDSWPSTPGVYIIRTAHSIPRIGGTDKTGILYIGKASTLRFRIWHFWKANHTASGFLWNHQDIARVVLNSGIRSVTQVEEQLGRLTVRYATPLYAQQIARAERALLFSYIRLFGEAPPLNLSLPGRWDSAPSSQDLRWAEVGMQKRR
jgi:hypothetical protein